MYKNLNWNHFADLSKTIKLKKVDPTFKSIDFCISFKLVEFDQFKKLFSSELLDTAHVIKPFSKDLVLQL